MKRALEHSIKNHEFSLGYTINSFLPQRTKSQVTQTNCSMERYAKAQAFDHSRGTASIFRSFAPPVLDSNRLLVFRDTTLT